VENTLKRWRSRSHNRDPSIALPFGSFFFAISAALLGDLSGSLFAEIRERDFNR
jgi:hypothetical protein